MSDPATSPPPEDPEDGRKALLGSAATTKRTRVLIQVVIAFAAFIVLIVLLFNVFGGGKTVSQDEVESFLTTNIRGNDDSADCPDRLGGEKGDSVDCTVKAGGRTVRVKVVVIAVDGDRVRLQSRPAD